MQSNAPLNETSQDNGGCSDTPEMWQVPKPTVTTPQPPWIEYPRWVRLQGLSATDLNTCPWAKTVIERHKTTGKFRLRGQTCKRWQCPPCARQKIRDLAQWIKLAAPNRLLTLTVDPKLHDNPELAWITTGKQVSELVRHLRKRFGAIEYLRVIETTKAGWPHYHLVMRSAYLPQPVVKSIWQALTRATIVDLREVKNFFNSVLYLTKYLTQVTKQPVPWTDRKVTYSKGFFSVPINVPPSPSDWVTTALYDDEPHEYINRVLPQCTLVESAPGLFNLGGEPPEYVAPPPKEEQKEKPLREKQTNMGW